MNNFKTIKDLLKEHKLENKYTVKGLNETLIQLGYATKEQIVSYKTKYKETDITKSNNTVHKDFFLDLVKQSQELNNTRKTSPKLIEAPKKTLETVKQEIMDIIKEHPKSRYESSDKSELDESYDSIYLIILLIISSVLSAISIYSTLN
jgi:hypothetical protein